MKILLFLTLIFSSSVYATIIKYDFGVNSSYQGEYLIKTTHNTDSVPIIGRNHKTYSTSVDIVVGGVTVHSGIGFTYYDAQTTDDKFLFTFRQSTAVPIINGYILKRFYYISYAPAGTFFDTNDGRPDSINQAQYDDFSIREFTLIDYALPNQSCRNNQACEFKEDTDGGGLGITVSTPQAASVPEPVTLASFLLGLIAVASRARKLNV
ncbi:PEP-CTERM sorting domain-containing protein [Alginatibacterium sediminis]|nr:PEP-CTERM sorting domain-containing protein [Alginatibacterium sediminis]